MKTDKEIFIRNFAEYSATLGDNIDMKTVWNELSVRGNKMIRNNRRFGEVLIRRELKKSTFPINIDGVEYNNSSRAAKAHNLDRHIVNHRLVSPYFPTWVDSRVKKRVNGTQEDHFGRKSLIVIINNTEYPSITTAGKALGMSVGAVYHRLHSPHYPEWNIK